MAALCASPAAANNYIITYDITYTTDGKLPGTTIFPDNVTSFKITKGMNLVLRDYHTATLTKIENRSEGMGMSKITYGFSNRGFKITMNNGTIDNYGGFLNSNLNGESSSKLAFIKGTNATITNHSGAYFNNNTLLEVKTIDNKGTFTHSADADAFKNSTSFNAGEGNDNVYAKAETITNSGTFMTYTNSVLKATNLTNEANGVLENRGTLEASGKLTNNGTLTNKGTIDSAIDNAGTINANASVTTNFNKAVTQKQGGVINVNGYTTFKETVTTSTGSSINVADYQTANFSKAFTNASGAKFNLNATDYAVAMFSEAVENKGEMNVAGGVWANKGFTNAAGGKITFKKYTSSGNAVLSQIILGGGTFKNEGLIFVDISGLDLNKKYSFVSTLGSAITYDDGFKEVTNDDAATKGVKITNAEGTYDYQQSTGTLKLVGYSNIGTDENDNASQKEIENAVKNAGLSISKQDLTNAMGDIKTTLQESVIAQPRAMMNAFKMDSSAAQLQGAIAGFMAESAGVYYATNSHIISDAVRVRGAKRKSADDGRLQIFATPFGGGLSGDEISGHLLGIALGATYFGENYIAQGSFAYANGSSSQDLATQSNELSANLLQLGGFGRYFLGKAVEIDANVNFVLGMFDLENSWASAAALNSSASFNDYEFNLGATGGYRFNELGVEAFSVKPFAGLQLYYNNQGSYTLDTLGLGVDSVSDFKMDILAGAEARYAFKNGNFAYLKLGYEQKLFNTAKDISVSVLGASGASSGALTYDNESYDGFFAANLGGRVLSINSWRLDIEGVFKHYDSGLNYFGGNLSVKYAF